MGTGLERASGHFKLQRPVEESNKEWDAYTAARLATAKRSLSVLNVTNPADASEDDVYYDSDSEETILVNNTRKAVQALAEPLGVDKDALVDAVHILHCNADFDDESPRTVTILSRIYSISTPYSIDVHFKYHSRARYYEIEWFYGIGYRINKHPTLTALQGRDVMQSLAGSSVSTMHSQRGWNNIAWGLFDDSDGNYGKRWKRILQKDSGLYREGVLDVYESLFGALPDAAEGEQEQQNIDKLVLGVQLLLASVGVKYDIAVREGERDVDPGRRGSINWDLNGWGRWLPREIRRACGLTLTRDPVEEAREKQDYEEQLEDDEDDEDRDDDDEDDDW